VPDDEDPEAAPVKLNDLDGQRFANALKRPAPPTSALVDLFRGRPQGAEGSPARDRPALLLVPPAGASTSAAIRAAIARPSAPPVLLVDRSQAAEPEAPIDIRIGSPQRVPPVRRVDCAQPPAPWVCPPVRMVDCPVCSAKAGERCEGFDRWDECHAERLEAL
jgi:hypothetical protein